MTDNRAKRDSMSVEYATVSDMREMLAIAESSQDDAPSEVVPSCLSPHASCR